MVGAFKPNPLRDICAALEIDDLSADPRYCDLTQQFKNKAALQAIFRERYAGNTREHWLARLEAVDILCSPVRDLREALVDPQTLHNQMLIEGDGEGQRVRFINSPITMSSAQVGLRARRPGSGSITRTCCASWRKLRIPQGGAMSVHLRIENHVATVTLARPDVLNAVDLATEAALQRIWTEIEGRDDVRVVVLTGEGERAFCVGADLKNPTTTGLEYWGAARPGGFGGIALRETLNVPVVARVNGFALGGGFEMVLGCDIVVACEEASFGLPEALVGRMPLDGGMTLLQRQIPYRKAMAMLLTGRRIPAREAAELGLINEVVPRAGLDEAVQRWVDALLACAPLSQQAIKQVVRTGTLSPADAQALRLPALVAALQSEDAHEGVLAFQQKRKPQWRGR